jgi:thioredoxin-like negative regulator of GroEL
MPSSVETAVFSDEDIDCLTGITVVAFWAQWSEPCRTLLGVLNAAAQSYCARARIISADFSVNKSAVKRFEIQLLPTILVFQDSDLKERAVGKQSLQSLTHLLEKYVKQ